MKSFIRGRVVKSYDIEVSSPRLLESNEGFRQLGACLTVLTDGIEGQTPLHSEWLYPSLPEEAQEKAALLLAEAEVSAQIVLAQAEARAQEILAQAEVHAQEILAQAQADLERLRQEVVETAQAEIYPAAQTEGYRAGFEAGETEGKRPFEKANQLFQLAQRAIQEEFAKVDEALLHLSLKIAERLVRSSLTFEPQRLIEIIRALTLLPQERSGWRLHVSSADATWLENLSEGSLPPCPWVRDDSLSPGDCFLECQEGIFDARLEAQLDKLEHTLREELENGGLESINSDSGTD